MSKRWKSLKMVLVLALAAVMLTGWVASSVAETVTIAWGVSSGSGPSGYVFREEQIAQLYEQRNPEINVDMQEYVGSWSEKVTAQMVAGTAADVIQAYGNDLVQWMDGGQLLSLEEYFDEEFLEDFPPAQLNLYGRGQDGVLYSIPVLGGPQWALFYNKNMFDKAGVSYPDDSWDWNSLLDAAKKLTTKEPGKPSEFGYQVIGSLGWNLMLYIWQNGGRIAPEGERRATKILIDQPAALEAIEFLHDMAWKYHVSPTPAQQGEMRPWDTFLYGKVAMQLNGVGDFKFNWEGARFRWDIARPPKGPVGRANVGGMDSVFVYKGTEHPEEAVKFLEFLVSAEVMEIVIREESLFPARQSVLPRWAELSEFAGRLNLDNIVEDAPNMRNMPVFKDDAKVMELLNPVTQQMFKLNKIPVREGIIEVVKKINAFLAGIE